MSTAEYTHRIADDTPAWRLPGISLILVAAAVAAMPFEAINSRLQYDRAAVGDGQIWRLLTCQLTHWSWDHLFWDAAALLLLGWVLERENRRSLLICLGLSVVLIPVVVHFALADLAAYRGLSGIDSAIFVLLAVTLFRKCRAERDRLRTWACAAMLVGFTAKIAFELVAGTALFVDAEASQMIPVPLAHVVGGILGAVCGWCGKLDETERLRSTGNDFPRDHLLKRLPAADQVGPAVLQEDFGGHGL